MSERIEYKIKTVERYIITRYQGDNEAGAGSVTERGEHASPHVAYQVAYALAKLDHERLGYPIDDERIQYPRHPQGMDEEAQAVFLPERGDSRELPTQGIPAEYDTNAAGLASNA